MDHHATLNQQLTGGATAQAAALTPLRRHEDVRRFNQLVDDRRLLQTDDPLVAAPARSTIHPTAP